MARLLAPLCVDSFFIWRQARLSFRSLHPLQELKRLLPACHRNYLHVRSLKGWQLTRQSALQRP